MYKRRCRRFLSFIHYHLSIIIYSFSLALRWLLRFRKRRGYGVHSPFAFSLITGVFFEKGEYYAYAPLHEWRKGKSTATFERNDKLLFRLINEHQPKTGLIIGDKIEVPTEYLKAGCKSCKFIKASPTQPPHKGESCCVPDGTLPHFGGVGGGFDFCYIASSEHLAEVLPAVLPLLSERALLVAEGACASKSACKAWKTFVAEEKIRVSFDLYELGLAYTEARLNKQDYVISWP